MSETTHTTHTFDLPLDVDALLNRLRSCDGVNSDAAVIVHKQCQMLVREVDRLRALLEGDQPRVIELNRDGVLSIEHWSARLMAASFAQSLGDASNGVVLEMIHTDPDTGAVLPLVVTVRRKSGKTVEEIFLAAQSEVERLDAAIRAHRDQRGDDRCWQDDETLYAVLPEGCTPPARDARLRQGRANP